MKTIPTIKGHFDYNICFRYPVERPSVSQLQNHVFFKQSKQTSLYEQFVMCGIEALDCTTSRIKGNQFISIFGI